jgi:hypothetical protein
MDRCGLPVKLLDDGAAGQYASGDCAGHVHESEGGGVRLPGPPDKAEVSGSSQLRPTSPAQSHLAPIQPRIFASSSSDSTAPRSTSVSPIRADGAIGGATAALSKSCALDALANGCYAEARGANCSQRLPETKSTAAPGSARTVGSLFTESRNL